MNTRSPESGGGWNKPNPRAGAGKGDACESGNGGWGSPAGSYRDGYASDSGDPVPGERGYRRKKLAAIANNMYKVGATAVSEIRESYAQQRSRELFDSASNTIPGSFPDAAITVQGDDHLVIFPSYAKEHARREWGPVAEHSPATPRGAIRDQDYWRDEWERGEDERATVDVDVRGWLYRPHRGPLTRKHRFLLGVARQLSGLPPPKAEGSKADSWADANELRSDQEKIAREAAEIERRGQEEKRVAGRGAYSEVPHEEDDPEHESIYYAASRDASPSSPSSPSRLSPPPSPALSARTSVGISASVVTGMSDAELALAHTNLMARIAPFLTTPLVQQSVSVFFYNDTKSQSKTATTNQAGHFSVRAALDFVPTHVRVLANERLSAIQAVKVTGPHGISVISDIDDTIKKSNISGGAKEIFRHTFCHSLADLAVDGVREWYTAMQQLGVSFHYCSNSPWQLFPVLSTFFSSAGLPPGSLHLKQYSGVFHGIFEPVAERKKSTLLRLLADFPQRRFILVGDSGEADLEVYAELAVAHPGRILAIFIRDVTTPDRLGFFTASFEEPSGSKPPRPGARPQERGPDLGRRRNSQPDASLHPAGPVMGTLIDFSSEREDAKANQSDPPAQARWGLQLQAAATGAGLPNPKTAPPRPAKPDALRARASSDTFASIGGAKGEKPPLPDPAVQPRKALPALHPLSQIHNSSQQTAPHSPQSTPNALQPSKPSTALNPSPESTKSSSSSLPPPPPPPRPPRRRGTSGTSNGSSAPSSFGSSEPRLQAPGRTPSSNSNVEFDALPPSSCQPWAAPGSNGTPKRSTPPTTSLSGSRNQSPSIGHASPALGPSATNNGTAVAVNRKLDMWRRRLQRAQDVLDGLERSGKGRVALYTWRNGGDVVEEALGLIEGALSEEKHMK